MDDVSGRDNMWQFHSIGIWVMQGSNENIKEITGIALICDYLGISLNSCYTTRKAKMSPHYT